MAVRDRLIKMLGGSPAMDAIEGSVVDNGMINRPFSPGEPIHPADGYSNTPRSRDYLTGINIASRPRLNERVAFSTLRGLVDSYDVAQMCIWHRIDSIRSLQWSLVPKSGKAGVDMSAAIELGNMVLAKPDREFPFHTWIAKYLYDILAFDAGTLFKMRNVAGRPVGLRVIDGTTIAPLLDYWGNRPTGDAPAFVQFAQGIPWEWLTNDDIVYEPYRPQSNSVYGKAPLETILLNANTDLRFQSFFLNRFTEGNVPEGFAESPEGWTPDQLIEWQEKWDAMLYGDDTRKHQIRWVPNGTSFTWSNESPFDDTFSLFLMRKTAAAFHVVPSDLGFTETVNLASSESQVDVQFRVGDLPLIQHVEGILSRFLQDDLGLPLNFEFDTGKESEDRLTVAQAHKLYIEAGVISASDIREEVYGLNEPDGLKVPRFIMTQRSGPVPLSALYAVAGPTDPESAAPIPGGPLPHKPFAPIEGVTPQQAPSQPPLAVQRYPADNAPSALAALGEANKPVLKEATSGITEATGAYGSPLIADGDDEDDESPSVTVEKAAFRRYTKARIKKGVWRDFQFTATPARAARELNRQGRARVRKETGEVSVAGLCVLAADTGRVLMLQRGLDPADPASGMWEFPGGHLEGDESVLQGAVREWCEETGCPPPVDGEVVNQWTSSNGIYQGIVLQVPSEACCPINPDVPHLANPDDPDGDLVETCAWWDPTLLVGNPAVRQELAEDLGMVLAALEPSEVVKAAMAGGWDAHPFRRIEDALAAHHAPKIQAGLRSLVSKEQIRAAVETYLAHGQ